jgi:hypothetical protein
MLAMGAVVMSLNVFQTTPVQDVAQPKLVEVAMPTPPLLSLPVHPQRQFACIAYTESRGKVVDTNPVSNAQGTFQFLPYIWQYARNYVKGLPPTPNEADVYQQQAVAVFYYNRNHGLYPEWTDGCERI